MFNLFKKPEPPKTLSAWEQIIEVVKSDPKVSNLEATRHEITCQYQDLKLTINDDSYIVFEVPEEMRFGTHHDTPTGDTIVSKMRRNWVDAFFLEPDTLMVKVDENYAQAKSRLMVHANLAGHEGYLGQRTTSPSSEQTHLIAFVSQTPISIANMTWLQRTIV